MPEEMTELMELAARAGWYEGILVRKYPGLADDLDFKMFCELNTMLLTKLEEAGQ